jgi:hypothetical protein
MYSFAQAARNIERMGTDKTVPEKPLSTIAQETRSPEPVASTFDRDAVENMTLSELAHGDQAVTMWSEVLQDKILLVPDGYRRKPGDPVTYTAHEIDVLASMKSDENRREIHKVKKLMGGIVMTPEEVEKMKEKR